MSDWYCGTISILKKDIKKNHALAALIAETFYGIPCKDFAKLKDWKDLFDTPPIDDENWLTDDEVARFKDEQACYGGFPSIEECCQKYKIPYDLWSEGYYEYPSESYYYRPDVSEAEIICDGNTGERMYSESDLRAMASSVKNIKCPTTEDIHVAGKAFLDFLAAIPMIRPLEEYADG